MSKQVYDVIVDSLTIGPHVLGPCGENERFNIQFPDLFEVKDSNSGDLIASRNPARSATLTLTYFPTDSVAVQVAQIENDMQVPGSAVVFPGGAFTVADGQVVSFDDVVMVSRPAMMSGKSASVVTATFALVNARRVIPA